MLVYLRIGYNWIGGTSFFSSQTFNLFIFPLILFNLFHIDIIAVITIAIPLSSKTKQNKTIV